MITKRKNRTFSYIVILLLAGICIVTAAIIYLLFDRIPNAVSDTFGPPSPSLSLYQQITYPVRLLIDRDGLINPVSTGGQAVTFRIEQGESASSISIQLQESGLIRNAGSFQIFLVYAGLDTHIQAGVYSLDPSKSAIEIAKKLQDASPEEITFTILPGWRIEEIAASLPTSGLSISPDDFTKTANNTPFGIPLGDPDPSITSTEGFLYPGTYKFKRSISLDEMIESILQNFDANVDKSIREGFEHQGLTLLQGVTLASIVQREAVVEDEQPIIASVFFNRLKAGMKLESDPTVQYALGFNAIQQTWWTNPLSAADLKVDSAYNTYLYAGIPPGPISNPGLSALQAVAFPAQTPYYYFRARCDSSGRHNFATTLEEQLNNACP